MHFFKIYYRLEPKIIYKAIKIIVNSDKQYIMEDTAYYDKIKNWGYETAW